MTRFFVDTEFCEDGRTIDLISIGVVAEDGREFYYQNANANLHRANPWVVQNVIPQLTPCPAKVPVKAHMSAPCGVSSCAWKPKYWIRKELDRFCDPNEFGKPEFWADYAAYDWIVVCQLFGRMVDLPPGWPMFCNDIQQEALRQEVSQTRLDVIGSLSDGHNALNDARFARACWEYLSAGTGNKQKASARKVSEKPGHVRSAQARGQDKVRSGGDQQRGAKQNRKTGRSSLQEVR